MTSPLANSARIAAELRQRLAAEFQLAEDDEAIDGTISGEVDLPEQVARLAREALRAETYAEGIKGLIEDHKARKARLEAKADKLRAMIAWALAEAGYRRLPLPDMTLTLATGKPPLIVNDDDVPQTDDFGSFKFTVSKTKIRSLIEQGNEFAFARIGQAAPTLKITRG